MKLNVCTTLALFGIALSAHPIHAQTAAILVGRGYSAPSPPEVAPGQILSMFFRGVPALPDGKLRSGKAETSPLPTTLAGLALRITHAERTFPVPILGVQQERDCPGSAATSPACLITSVRIQVPFEIADPGPVPADPTAPVFTASVAELAMDVDGEPGRSFLLQPVPTDAHVITSCDLAFDVQWCSVCNRLAFHADGRVIDAKAPAQPGETMLIFAYGLGPTWPPAETGKVSPAGSEIVESGTRRVWATIRNEPLNASASSPKHFDAEARNDLAPSIRFAGLAPGQIGLYQLNIEVPTSFTAALPCGGEIRSNGVLLVTTATGSETVPVCIQS